LLFIANATGRLLRNSEYYFRFLNRKFCFPLYLPRFVTSGVASPVACACNSPSGLRPIGHSQKQTLDVIYGSWFLRRGQKTRIKTIAFAFLTLRAPGSQAMQS